MYKIALALITLLLTFPTPARSAVYQVGGAGSYSSPYALYLAGVIQDGDTVDISPGSYSGQPALAVWSANNLFIRGIGTRPQMIANGLYIQGKGIWVIGGNNCRVENIEFSGAAVPDMNGAGIRLDGSGLTLRHCFFHDNENGLLTSNPYSGDILIEYCEFSTNGYGDGYTHNLYIGHVNKLIFRYNYSHHAKVGHNLKSRANENIILYNRIMDEQNGNSSRLIDLPNGGFSLVMGNLLMQGPNALNNNLIGYGLEGLSNSNSQLHVINNSFLNKRIASCLFLDINPACSVAVVANNIFAGSGTLSNGASPLLQNNLIEPVIQQVGLTNEALYDYSLTAGSPAIDAGAALGSIGSYSGVPNHIYKHPCQDSLRLQDGHIDIGAYEFMPPNRINDNFQNLFRIFPNPTKDIIFVDFTEEQIERIQLFDMKGTLLLNKQSSNCLDLSELPQGNYLITCTLQQGRTYTGTIVRQ